LLAKNVNDSARPHVVTRRAGATESLYQTPPTNFPLSIRRLYALSRLANQKYNGEVTASPTTHDKSAPLMCCEIGPTYSGVFMNGICTAIPTA